MSDSKNIKRRRQIKTGEAADGGVLIVVLSSQERLALNVLLTLGGTFRPQQDRPTRQHPPLPHPSQLGEGGVRKGWGWGL